MKTLKKEYGYRDVIMLIAAKTAACNFKDNISELSKVNPKWNAAYADDLLARLEDAHNNHLGYDARKDLRNATSTLRDLIRDVKNSISVFRNLVNNYYKDEPEKKDEIFNALGFKQYSKKRVAGTQSGLINLLYAFKCNLTDAMRLDLLSKGVVESVIDNIITNASALENSNTIQEVLKFNTGEKIAYRKTLYNGIYREINGICLMATSHYKTSKTKKAMFNFNKIAKAAERRQKQEAENTEAGNSNSNEGNGKNNPPPAN